MQCSKKLIIHVASAIVHLRSLNSFFFLLLLNTVSYLPFHRNYYYYFLSLYFNFLIRSQYNGDKGHRVATLKPAFHATSMRNISPPPTFSKVFMCSGGWAPFLLGLIKGPSKCTPKTPAPSGPPSCFFSFGKTCKYN